MSNNPLVPPVDGRPRLLELPGEIVNTIYEYSLTTHKPLTRLQQDHSPQATYIPPAFNQLKHVCRKLREDTAGLELRFNRINVHVAYDYTSIGTYIWSFKSQLTPREFMNVHRVDIIVDLTRLKQYLQSNRSNFTENELFRFNTDPILNYDLPHRLAMLTGQDIVAPTHASIYEFCVQHPHINVVLRLPDIELSHFPDQQQLVCNVSAMQILAPGTVSRRIPSITFREDDLLFRKMARFAFNYAEEFLNSRETSVERLPNLRYFPLTRPVSRQVMRELMMEGRSAAAAPLGPGHGDLVPVGYSLEHGHGRIIEIDHEARFDWFEEVQDEGI
jgi:hypothetical protein